MQNWKNTILKQTDTMEKAIQVLNKESLRIVMVVNDDDQLVGTITDGDIRRGLLGHLSVNSELSDFMFMKPTVALEEESRDDIFLKMKNLDLLQIPIVDKNNKVTGLETLHHLINNKRDNPVFLMAGGFGKRLRPLTNDTPKPLLKVGGKPILESILEQFIREGFHNFYISIHYKADMIRRHFGDGSDRGVTIEYIHEKTPLGTAGSLGLLPDNIQNLPILMMNGDLLTRIDFLELLRFHELKGGDATVCVREYDLQVPYGVIKAEGSLIVSIKEKPKHKFFVNAGIYILDPKILREVDGLSYLDMPQLLERKIDGLGQVNMFPMHEYWLDIGQIDQFEQAQKDSLNYF
jgi:dTDP-glucose pyrophosphorylase